MEVDLPLNIESKLNNDNFLTFNKCLKASSNEADEGLDVKMNPRKHCKNVFSSYLIWFLYFMAYQPSRII